MLLDDGLEGVSHFGGSAPSLHESDCNDGVSFWSFITTAHLPFISIKMTPVHGSLGPHSDHCYSQTYDADLILRSNFTVAHRPDEPTQKSSKSAVWFIGIFLRNTIAFKTAILIQMT